MYKHIHRHRNMYIYVYIYIHICIHVYIHIYLYICVYMYMYYMHTSCIEAQNGLAQVIADSEMPCGRSDIPPILRISGGERYLSDLPLRCHRARNRKPLTSTSWYEVYTMNAFRRLWLAKRADTHLHIRHENVYTSDIMKLHINCSIGEGGPSNRTN